MINWVTRDHWSTSIIRNLLDNKIFKHRFINRIADHLNTSFTPERVLDVINRKAKIIEPEIAEHIVRWQFPGSGSITKWKANVQVLKDFANYRPQLVYENVSTHFEIDRQSDLTVDVSDPAAGRIHVNNAIEIVGTTPGVDPDPWPWTGTYFKSVPVTLKAAPFPGYTFSHWDGLGTDSDLEEIEMTMDRDLIITAVFKKNLM